MDTLAVPPRAQARGALPYALRASVPVMLGYVPIGMAFGLVLVGAGLPWWLAPLMSLFVYAGAAQFMGVGLLTGGAGLLEIGLLTLLMNARHAVYGLSLLKPFSRAGRRKPYLVFGLTDETYGILSTSSPPEDVHEASFYTWLTALDQLYWFFGSTAGALLGASLGLDTTGLDFALTALFVVLLVEQTRSVKRVEPYLAALASGVLAFAFANPRDFLIVAILLSGGFLAVLRKRLEGDPGKPSRADVKTEEAER